ncbi:MAG: tetratricopeptide repeat protein [Candidatus Competibacteraceae bacterium]
MAVVGKYLKSFKRLTGTLTNWVRHPLGSQSDPNLANCADLREQAWRHCTQGEHGTAVGLLQDQITQLDAQRRTERRDQELAATLGILAAVYRNTGRPGAALAAAERELHLYRSLGQDQDVANALGSMAELLTRQRRYADAEARYADAFCAAQLVKDRGLQAIILEKLGVLKRQQEHYSHAIILFKEAISLLQRAGIQEEEMRLWDVLATTEVQQGELDTAELSYARSFELAERLGDRSQLAIYAQNVGILYQKRAEQSTDAAIRQALLQQAVASVEKSLTIKLEMGNEIGAEASYFQLGILFWRLGQWTQAEEYLLRATELSEALNLPKVYKNYNVLARFAKGRGEQDAAAHWQAKCDAKVTELQHRL